MRLESRVTPYDLDTGLPLPINPSHELPDPLPPNTPNVERKADWHHPEHPGNELASTRGELGLRHSVLQWVMYDDHHLEGGGYHLWSDGPPLPKTEEARFGQTLPRMAGWIPREAVDYSGDPPEIVALSDDTRDIMRERGDFRVASFFYVTKFWVEHVTGLLLPDNAGGISRETVHRLLNANTIAEKVRLSADLLGQLALIAVDPHRDMYMTAHKNGLLSPTARLEPEKMVEAIIVSELTVNPIEVFKKLRYNASRFYANTKRADLVLTNRGR